MSVTRFSNARVCQPRPACDTVNVSAKIEELILQSEFFNPLNYQLIRAQCSPSNICPRYEHFLLCTDRGPKLNNLKAKVTKTWPDRVCQRIFRKMFNNEVYLIPERDFLTSFWARKWSAGLKWPYNSPPEILKRFFWAYKVSRKYKDLFSWPMSYDNIHMLSAFALS